MEYLVGTCILGAIWLAFYLSRKDLRKGMVWSGKYYFIVLTLGFLAIKLVSPYLSLHQTIIPGYWNPNTLFDLGRLTGGYSIEDALYIFFTGGIAMAAYEILFRKKLGHRHTKHHP